ncbi:MAG: GIY-YIG nuclease family protein [Thermodesulfobacteriota bacterium]
MNRRKDESKQILTSSLAPMASFSLTGRCKTRSLANLKGSYCLVAYLSKGCFMAFGKNSAFFPRGWYAYVGSAMNGIDKRVQRHLRSLKKMRWHIDFLLDKAVVKDVIPMPSELREECAKAAALKAIGGVVIARKFGSTDCRCETHLLFFRSNPIKRRDFWEALREQSGPGCLCLSCGPACAPHRSC